MKLTCCLALTFVIVDFLVDKPFRPQKPLLMPGNPTQKRNGDFDNVYIFLMVTQLFLPSKKYAIYTGGVSWFELQLFLPSQKYAMHPQALSHPHNIAQALLLHTVQMMRISEILNFMRSFCCSLVIWKPTLVLSCIRPFKY